MITKCPYCDYRKPDEPLSIDIVRQVLEADKVIEDYLLWFRRLMEVHTKRFGFKSYRGVKVHIGLKHKGEYNSPNYEFNEDEKALLKSYEPIR